MAITNPTKREVLNRLAHLPQSLQDAAFSEENALALERVAAEFKLGATTSRLARLTGRVLLGFLSPNYFIAALQDTLKIDREIARGIAQKISQAIFLPVRQELIELYHLQPAQSPPSQPAPQAPPSPPVQPPPPLQRPTSPEAPSVPKPPPAPETQSTPPPPRPTPSERLMAEEQPNP